MSTSQILQYVKPEDSTFFPSRQQISQVNHLESRFQDVSALERSKEWLRLEKQKLIDFQPAQRKQVVDEETLNKIKSIRRQLPNTVNQQLLEVEPVAQYFELRTNQEFNSKINVECRQFKDRDVKRELLFSTPRYGIPGEHRINQAGINSDKLLERLIKR